MSRLKKSKSKLARQVKQKRYFPLLLSPPLLPLLRPFAYQGMTFLMPFFFLLLDSLELSSFGVLYFLPFLSCADGSCAAGALAVDDEDDEATGAVGCG